LATRFASIFRAKCSAKKTKIIASHENNLKEKSILVTGAAGFIGSNIIDQLVKNGCKKIIALDNLVTGDLRNIDLHIANNSITFIRGDITDPETCMNATRNVDVVLHQAALGSVPRSIENPVNTHNVNVNGFVNMLEACRHNKVKRFVYASSSSVYGDNTDLPKKEEKTGKPLSPYAVTKVTNELYAKVFADVYKMEIIGLRYFNVFGPKQNPSGPYAAVIPIFVNRLLKNETCVIYGDGNNRRDFTYVDNVVSANILAAATQNQQALGQVFNIAYGATKSVKDLYTQIKSLLGSDLSANHLPQRVGDIKDSFASVEKAKNLLGYAPLVDLDNGIVKTIEWYKQHLNDSNC
jgi:UDP-N-acetylglucosamine 4-epimerase